MDKQIKSTEAMDKQIKSSEAMNNQTKSTEAMDKQTKSTQAMDKQTKSTQAMDKQTKSTQAINKQNKANEAMDKQTKSSEAMDNQTKPSEAMDNQTKSTQAMDNQNKSTEAMDKQTKSTEAINNQTKSSQAMDKQRVRLTSSVESTEDFRIHGKELIDFIANYYDEMKLKPVTPTVAPGYIRDLIKKNPPNKSTSFSDIIDVFRKAIEPGLSQWQSPRFHAYFPTGSSFPSMLGTLLGEAVGCAGFSWIANPACTELECVVMDWLVDMMDLPTFFKHSSNGDGGGILLSSASEAAFVSMLAAKKRALLKLNCNEKQLVAYLSTEAHSSVERAALLCNINVKKIQTKDFVMDEKLLIRQIQQDVANDLIPVFVCATIGTTSTCAFDRLDKIGEIAKEFPLLWFHVDAAYGGSSFVCPEFRYLNKGVEFADSYLINVSKWLLVSIECSAFYLKHSDEFTKGYMLDPTYLQNFQENMMPDFRNWQIPLSRNFRSLKLWMVIMSYGVEGLQSHIRHQVALAKYFENLVKADDRFEIINNVTLGLVCFRLKGHDDTNKDLIFRINQARNIFLCPSSFESMFFLRFCVCSRLTTASDIETSWMEIQRHANDVKKQKLTD